MTNLSLLVAVYLGLAPLAVAHMNMWDPKPLGYGRDDDLHAPLDSGSYPCKNYHKNPVDTEKDQSKRTTWTQGQEAHFSLEKQVWHDGGSCQACLSDDHGKTWTVMKTFLGSCPSGPGKTSYSFTVPSDAPVGNELLFAWNWYNKVGNRELYQNCAFVKIEKSKNGNTKNSAIEWKNRPKCFEANIFNDRKCTVPDDSEVIIPNPGPDVTPNVRKFEKLAFAEGPGCEAPANGSLLYKAWKGRKGKNFGELMKAYVEDLKANGTGPGSGSQSLPSGQVPDATESGSGSQSLPSGQVPDETGSGSGSQTLPSGQVPDKDSKKENKDPKKGEKGPKAPKTKCKHEKRHALKSRRQVTSGRN